MLAIGNGAGFLGDNIAAPRRLITSARLDFLTLEYLAELTMSILARQREKDPEQGFVADLLTVLEDLAEPWTQQPRLRVVTNGGGLNPTGCARAASEILCKHGLAEFPVSAVTGDDLVGRLTDLSRQGCRFEHLDTGQPLESIPGRIVSANAYLGATPIVDSLSQGARLVITGRVADASLTVGPAMHQFGWRWDDWPQVATATVAGHLIECGAQVTGGYSGNWRGADLANVGYPIVEIDEHGNCVVTKPAGSGGAVNIDTVSEQLVYEIGDPRHYLTPDIDLDLTGVSLQQVGNDRVQVLGARGAPPTSSYKVSLAYESGYMVSGQLLVYGPDCVEKAHACARIVHDQLTVSGHAPQGWNVECLGAGDGVPGVAKEMAVPIEVMLRITAHDASREKLERLARQMIPLATSGPAGLAGYAAGRPQVRPVYAYWPTLIPREFVPATVKTRTARDWVTTK